MNKVGSAEKPLLGPIFVKNDTGDEFWRGGDAGSFHAESGIFLNVKFTGTNVGDIGFASGNNKSVVTFTVGDGIEANKEIAIEATNNGVAVKQPVFIAPASKQAIALFSAEAAAKGWTMVAVPVEEVRARFNLPGYGWEEPVTAVKVSIRDIVEEALAKIEALVG